MTIHTHQEMTMAQRSTGPACGNNPNHPLTEGDRQAIADFRVYLAARAALRDRIADALREHYLSTNRDEADADRNMPCRCGDWREPGAEVDDENDWDSHLADVVLAVLPEPADRAAVLREAIDVARDEACRLEEVAGIEVARGARCVAYLLRKLLAKAQPATETVHACPPNGSGVTPCCGRTPFELPPTERMTTAPALVTCAAPAAQQPAAEAQQDGAPS